MEKAIAKSNGPKASTSHPSSRQSRGSQSLGTPLLDFSRTVGNQAMESLFASGMVQAKLRVSQPGDADEDEADRAAEQIVSKQSTPRLQHKCGCGGSCPRCQQEESVTNRSTLGPLRRSPPSLQRSEAHVGNAKPERDLTRHRGARPQVVVVEDEAPKLETGQMRKSQFLTLLESTACATADAVLEAVGHSTTGCPYIKKWLAHYRDKSAEHLMGAMVKYAPETRRARSAHEAISLVNQRVERAALSWVKTGKVSGLPEDMQAELMGGAGGFLGAVAGFAKSGVGKGLLSFLGGGGTPEISFGGKDKKKGQDEAGAIQKKSNGGSAGVGEDVASVKGQLGSGQSLDGRVQGRMSSAFGYDFSGVRVHTDSRAGELSSQLNARAFTMGSDIAFAGGEYRPGTPLGDALIAHELAHVVQQSGGKPGLQTKDASLANEDQLEQDADRSAVGAVVSTWTRMKTGLAMLGTNALPRLKSGLKLQKCAGSPKRTKSPAKVVPPPSQSTAASASEPSQQDIDPEKSYFFEDPKLQIVEEEEGKGSEIDFGKKSGAEETGITSSIQQRKQVVVDKAKDFSTLQEPLDPRSPKKDRIRIVIRFAYSAAEFPGGSESKRLTTAKQAVLSALAQLIVDLGTFQFASRAEEKKILQERVRLSQALRGYNEKNPLNIYLASESEEETRSGQFYPTTARVYVDLKDVGTPDKLKTAIRIPLHNILGGPNPAKGTQDDKPASTVDMEKTLLHEPLHALLISKDADSETVWKRLERKLTITGSAKVQEIARNIVHAYLLAQEEVFVYSAVELLFPENATQPHEGKPAYDSFIKNFAKPFLAKHGTMDEESHALETVKGKAVPWTITYRFPSKLSLEDQNAEELGTLLQTAWPLGTIRRR